MLSRKNARIGAYIVLGTFVASLLLVVAGIAAQYLGAHDFAKGALGVGVFLIGFIVVWKTLPRHAPCSKCTTGTMSTPRIHEDAAGSILETSYCRSCGYVDKHVIRRVA